MADYGTHPTVYGKLSNTDLFAMYRSESWSQMNEFSRRELLQETVNRSAELNGEKGSCRVEFTDLEDGTAGVQSGNVIQLDRSRFVNDCVTREYNGHIFFMPLTDSNLQALETVLHEDIHAWQNQCIDGTIPCSNPQLLAEYQSNNFDLSMVTLADGTVDMGQQYLYGSGKNGGYYLYYFQSTERDAHRFSEMRTQQVMSHLEQKFGSEPSFDAYKQNLTINGYQATLQRANNYFGTETVEKDINITLQNQFFGTDHPVTSSAVSEAVKNEMVTSLQESLADTQTQSSALDGQHQEAFPGLSEENSSHSEVPDNGIEM